MSKQPLAIFGSGIVSGVGNQSAICCAAIRAGIANFRESRFSDGNGGWIVASEVRLERPWWGVAKFARMAAAVIQESVRLDPEAIPSKTPIILCLAERDRPGRAVSLDSDMFDCIQRILRLEFHPASMVISHGRVGGVIALREARRLIYEEGHPRALIVCCDSYLQSETLTSLVKRRRILTSSNSDGFIPGEAAAAVIVKRPATAVPPVPVVLGIGFGIEPATTESEQPLRADGLVNAFREALNDAGCIPIESVHIRMSDGSGEQYWFKEAALAMARTARASKEDFDVWHIADSVGEVGAASFGIALNVAVASISKGYSVGNSILCHFGNDDGKRAAAVVSVVEQ